jgi:hypothetical protein
MLEKFLIFIIVLIAILAGIDTVQEGQPELLGLVIPAAISGPLFAFLWMRLSFLSPWNLPAKITCSFMVMLSFVIYILYVRDGPSDPNTAGHMHTILYPTAYLLFSIFLSIALSFLLKIAQRHNKYSGHRV